MAKTLVIGARGTVGSALVALLERQGHSIVAATRRRPERSGEVQLDLLTGAGRADAFAGVERAFLMSPPGYMQQDRLLAPLIDAARAQGVRKLVLMTAMGADADPQGPLRKAELYLAASGVPYNIIRPNWFMQNFNSYWLAGIRTAGTIFLPTGQARGSFIDARDIAAVAAALLGRDDLDGRDFNLTGGEALNHDEVAAILSRETGRRIVYADIPPEAMTDRLLAAGLPADYAHFLIVILGYFKAGYAAAVSDAVPQITGRAPISFAQYAKDYRQAWLQ